MAAARNPMIVVENVRKSFLLPHHVRTSFKEIFLHPFKSNNYERQVALDDVSFAVERGESFGIIGSNGSGKSTLLKIIAGIHRQDSGSVRVNGVLSPFIELGVGFNTELTARDNIRINGTLLGLSRKELDRRFDDIVAFAELERFVDQKLKNFSSGMQVRLAYSIAIQVDFDVLLLDEVLAVGDERFQAKCFETFDQMRAQGKTVLFVSHDLETLARFCERALLIEQGKPIMLGPTAGVIECYRSRGVATPIGQELAEQASAHT